MSQQARLLAANHTVELLLKRNDELSETVSTVTRMLHSTSRKREVLSILNTFRPDVVHVHNIYPSLGPAVHLACQEARIPLVMTVHNYRLRCPNGLMFTEGSRCMRCLPGNYANAVAHHCLPSKKQTLAYASVLWIHRYVLRLENRVSFFLCPSSFVRNLIVGWGIPPARVLAIPNFVYPRTDADPGLGSFGVFVGRLSQEKGVHVLLDALRIANDPPFRIIGDGPMAARLRDRAARLGLRQTVFLGRLASDRVDEALRDARFLVIPSLGDENCPIAALEGLAHGRPLLVTSRGGLPELVQEDNGLICRAGDAHDLAKGIDKLMMDDAFCQQAGARSLRASRSQFGPEEHLARLEAAYRACVANPSAPGHPGDESDHRLG